MITAKHYNDGFDRKMVKQEIPKIKLIKCLLILYYTLNCTYTNTLTRLSAPALAIYASDG